MYRHCSPMPLQTSDAIPAGWVYTFLHNTSEECMYIFLRAVVLRAIGNSVGFLLSGVALAFGVSSILLLFSNGRFKSRSRQDTLLCTFIVTLLLFVAAYQTQELLRTSYPALLFFQPLDERIKKGTKLDIINNTTVGIMVILSDGLLVWRCFMVQRVLGHGLSKWGNIFWIFPACLWAVTVAVAFSVVYLLHFNALPRNIGDTRFLGYITNTVLHTYATLFICIRLLHHRRMILACLGDTANTTRHIRIIAILLVLAVINLPATIACGFGIRSESVLGEVMLPIVVGIQVLASMLVIHQTALEKALSRPGQSDIDMLVELSEHGRNGSPNPAAQSGEINALTVPGTTGLDII